MDSKVFSELHNLIALLLIQQIRNDPTTASQYLCHSIADVAGKKKNPFLHYALFYKLRM